MGLPMYAYHLAGRSLVELGQCGAYVLARPRLEEPGEREREGVAWLGAGEFGEVAVPSASARAAGCAGAQDRDADGQGGVGRRWVLGRELAFPAHPLGCRIGVITELLRHRLGAASCPEPLHGGPDCLGNHVCCRGV